MEEINSIPSKPGKEKVRICPVCKQEVKVTTGLSNWKNLMRMPTLEEWITLFLIIAVIALFFAYKHDISQYQERLNACNLKCNPAGLNTSTPTDLMDNNLEVIDANNLNDIKQENGQEQDK